MPLSDWIERYDTETNVYQRNELGGSQRW